MSIQLIAQLGEIVSTIAVWTGTADILTLTKTARPARLIISAFHVGNPWEIKPYLPRVEGLLFQFPDRQEDAQIFAWEQAELAWEVFQQSD
jgi:hypothetical protein